MDRIQTLQAKRPWLKENEARSLLLTRYWKFTREMDMNPAQVKAMLDNCVTIYSALNETKLRNLIARANEFCITT